jgi:chorismate mutase
VHLDELRRALADVDRTIIAEVGRRLELASAIGQEKRRLGIATRDYGQEREVIERARAHAERANVPPPLAEELLALIRSSLTCRSARASRREEAAPGSAPS